MDMYREVFNRFPYFFRQMTGYLSGVQHVQPYFYQV